MLFSSEQSGIANIPTLLEWQSMETLLLGTDFPALTRVVTLFAIRQVMWFDSPPLREDIKEEEDVVTLISDCLPLLSASGRLIIE